MKHIFLVVLITGTLLAASPPARAESATSKPHQSLAQVLGAQRGATLHSGLNRRLDRMTRAVNAPARQSAAATSTPLPTATSTAPPGPLDFSVISVRAQTSNAPDYELVRPPVTQTSPGTTLYIFMYWILRSTPPGLRRTYHMAVERDGKLVTHVVFTGRLSAYPADTYEASNPYTFASLGKYTFTWQVTLGGQQLQGSTSVAVVDSSSHKGTGGSVTFDRLRVTNGNGKPSTTFRAGQTVRMSIAYTVHGPRGALSVTVGKSIQIVLNGQWTTELYSSKTLATTIGAHAHRLSYTIDSGFSPSVLRIVISLSIGRHTKSKHAVIHVTH